MIIIRVQFLQQLTKYRTTASTAKNIIARIIGTMMTQGSTPPPSPGVGMLVTALNWVYQNKERQGEILYNKE